MNFGMTRWNFEPLYPKPASPVHSCLKFSAQRMETSHVDGDDVSHTRNSSSGTAPGDSPERKVMRNWSPMNDGDTTALLAETRPCYISSLQNGPAMIVVFKQDAHELCVCVWFFISSQARFTRVVSLFRG